MYDRPIPKVPRDLYVSYTPQSLLHIGDLLTILAVDTKLLLPQHVTSRVLQYSRGSFQRFRSSPFEEATVCCPKEKFFTKEEQIGRNYIGTALAAVMFDKT